MIILITHRPYDSIVMGGKFVPTAGDYMEDALADLKECLGADTRTFSLPIKKAATWGNDLRVAIEKAHCEDKDFVFTWSGDDGCERFTVVNVPIGCNFSASQGEWVPA